MARTKRDAPRKSAEDMATERRVYTSGYWDGVRGVRQEFGEDSTITGIYDRGHKAGSKARAEGRVKWTPKRPPKDAPGRVTLDGVLPPAPYVGRKGQATLVSQTHVINADGSETTTAVFEAPAEQGNVAADADGALVTTEPVTVHLTDDEVVVIPAGAEVLADPEAQERVLAAEREEAAVG